MRVEPEGYKSETSIHTTSLQYYVLYVYRVSKARRYEKEVGGG